MKIAVIGAYDSRKTEVCSTISSYLIHNGIPKEQVGYVDAMDAIDKKLKEFESIIKKEDSEKTKKIEELRQDFIFNIQESMEILAEIDIKTEKHKFVILNKSLFDVYIYTEFKFPVHTRDFFYPELKTWLVRHPYDILLKAPILNGSQDTENKIKMDQRLEEILNELKVSYSELDREIFSQQPIFRYKVLDKYFGTSLKQR